MRPLVENIYDHLMNCSQRIRGKPAGTARTGVVFPAFRPGLPAHLHNNQLVVCGTASALQLYPAIVPFSDYY